MLAQHGETLSERADAQRLLLVVDARQGVARAQREDQGRAAMKRRGTPEADLQRAVVQTLRIALPRSAIIHHCANEVTEAGLAGRSAVGDPCRKASMPGSPI